MKIFGETILARFARKHATSRKPLARFLEIARGAEWKNFADLKRSLSSTDLNENTGEYIFDIGGNNFRLIAKVDFETQELAIARVLTHAEYDRE